MSQVIVVVPCYNEERRLDPAAFRQYVRDAPGVRFILVNDGSTDGTGGVLDELKRADPTGFAVEVLPMNAGKAEAVRRGFLAAFGLQPDYLAFWDADLATPLETIDRFREALDRRPELLMVIGSRIPLLGRRIVRKPVRRFLSRGFATAASWLLGVRVYDTQCGAKMFRLSPEIRLLFEEPFRTNWIFDVELLARFAGLQGRRDPARLTQRAYEFPLDEWREMSGSNVKLPGFAKAVWELIVLFFDYRVRRLWRRRYGEASSSATDTDLKCEGKPYGHALVSQRERSRGRAMDLSGACSDASRRQPARGR